MSKIYFISGLGADWRMFQFLKLPDHLEQHQIKWISPTSLDEPLDQYAQRLLPQIKDANPILVGFSFGGLVAVELAKMLNPVKTILISSIATRRALPWYYRVAAKTHLHRHLPLKVMQNTYPLAPYFFGAYTPYERRMLKSVFFRMDEMFLRWSLSRLFDWPQDNLIPNLIQIHGTDDLVLPPNNDKNIITVPHGKHLMIMHRAEEVSNILSRILVDCTHDRQE